jgi:cob(I)alamin adenosyltransferase
MSISTQRGDAGQTSLPGGNRVSKSDLRVEAYGTIDELISSMGLARALCSDPAIQTLTASIQRELFSVGSCLSALPDSRKAAPKISDESVDRLTAEVHRIEGTKGLLGDWALPGADAASAAYDVARTVCRRAERLAVRLSLEEPIDPNTLRYLNRLSDLLWLFGRLIEVERSVNSSLRDPKDAGPRWSRAW